MYKVDLNCDLGESFGAYKIGLDDFIIPLISSANIACGFHAGDSNIMAKTVQLCKKHNCSIGAHPGFPDLQGFGRRSINASATEVKNYVTYQIGALDAFCKSNGTQLKHIKPHGAMYNMAGKSDDLAKAIVDAIYDYNKELILLGLSGSKMISAAKDKGLPFASEVFADRAYENDGSLVARSKEGAMITDEKIVISRIIDMVTKGTVTSIDNKEIKISADSVCVHGDGEKALQFVSLMRDAFDKNDIEVCSIPKIVEG